MFGLEGNFIQLAIFFFAYFKARCEPGTRIPEDLAQDVDTVVEHSYYGRMVYSYLFKQVHVSYAAMI